MRTHHVFLVGAMLPACFPRVNPYDPQCDPTEVECALADAGEDDASTEAASDVTVGGANIVVNDVSYAPVHPGQTTAVEFYAKNTGTQAVSIVASLENVPTSVVVSNCVEAPSCFQTACSGACSCDATLSAAKQSVQPGSISSCQVLYFNAQISADAGAGVTIPVRFTSDANQVWHDQIQIVVQ